ncbi:MAG: GTP cyclohydrolase II [Myxococcales bacterium]|nr:GTP cyclohydrolase II [Myxococcales bacterium]
MDSKNLTHADANRLVVEARTPLPTRHGTFEVYVFRYADAPEKEHVAIVSGEVRGKHEVPIRVHSECLTSEVLGSLKCDCREQLEFALDTIAAEGGVVLYLRQEGRGIGLINKVKAYALQARGVDTVDANRQLGLPDDTRTYDSAAAMLDYLGVLSVRVMTNNPEKVEALRALGVDVRARVPVLIKPNPHSLKYLETKRVRMNHTLPPMLGTV